MKNTWIAYQTAVLLLLVAVILLGLLVNQGDSIETKSIIFAQAAILLSVFNIVIAMPVWLIVLVINRRKMDKKAWGIGLLLFLLFAGLAVIPFVEMLGYMYF
ncbi:hypothetical protein ACSFXN_03530 [Planococcus sp. 1R117A]|uniref:hypothetical protein n=1 Tax=Planococcus sp. 1R117A TaxID=3447020 RepID=UPI003EDC52A5